MKRLFLTVLTLLVLAGGAAYFLQQRTVGVWVYQNRDSEIRIDSGATGQLLQWKVAGRTFLNSPKPAPLTIKLASGEVAKYRAERMEQSADGRTLTMTGKFQGASVALPATLSYEASEQAESIRITLKLAAQEKPQAISEWQWAFPWQLDHHKKVYFRGEHGLDWETRYFYQFHLDTLGRVLKEPDRNEWRWFGADQLSPNAFRLWKSESDSTSRLIMQEGGRIAPYVQVYDKNGGVTVEYPQMTRGDQRSLRVDASGGGTVLVGLWSQMGPEGSGNTKTLSGEATSVILTAATDEKSLLAQRKALNAAFESPVKVDTEEILTESPWLRDTPLEDGTHTYVTGGYPFAKGALLPPYRVTVKVAGKPVPVQAAPLGYWPDGSAKWMRLTFPISTALAVKECPAPRVTLRNGQVVPIEVIANSAEPTAAENQPTLQTAEVAPGVVEVKNGALNVRFATGSQWLAPTLNNEPLLAKTGSARLGYADYLLDPKRYAPFARPEGGVLHKGTLTIDDVILEERGPLRAVVRLEGMANTKEPTRIIIRATMLAGRPEVALTFTAEFLYKDPRRTFLTGLGLELPLEGLSPHATTFGDQPPSEAIREIIQETYASRKVGILEESGGIRYETIEGGGGWVQADLGGGTRFQGVIRNFAETFPKAIALSENGEALRFSLWPESVPAMDTRRYSNEHHPGQGEAGALMNNWVEARYYADEPFVGVSRTHEILLGFWPRDGAPLIKSAAADFQSPPLLYAGWDTYRNAGVTLPTPEEKDWSRAWSAWTNVARFWIYHQKTHGWYGFWDYGDFRHHFQAGYGWVTSEEELAKGLQETTDPQPREKVIADYTPANDWAYDNGRWGWSNSEGLANLFLQNEYLRHGNRQVYFTSEAMANFCRDVVVRHDGKHFGLGTRHGVQHWSDSGHEERQTTTTEYRLNYFLSGNARTRDVVRKLYDGHYSKAPASDAADHSGRWGGLFFHQELTGSPDEAEQLRRYAHLFTDPEGLYQSPQVRFPGPILATGSKGLNEPHMFFACFGGMHYLQEYQRAFEDPQVAQSLLAMAKAALAVREKQGADVSYNSSHLYTLPAVAFAALHAEDTAPYREYLRKYLSDEKNWRALYQTVSENPQHWSGATAFLTGNAPGSFFWNNWAPVVTAALPSDGIWNAKVEALYQKAEREGEPKSPPATPWLQTEMPTTSEGPVFDYLNRHTPWTASPSPTPRSSNP